MHRITIRAIWCSAFSMVPFTGSPCLAQNHYAGAANRIQDGSATYRILSRVPLSGMGHFDLLALDSINRRLYVTRANRIQILNVDQLTIVGEIPNTPDVHAVVVALPLGLGFATAAGDTALLTFDLKSLRPIRRTKLAHRGLDGAYYEPSSNRLLVFSADGRAIVVEATSGQLVGDIDLGGYGESAVSDSAGLVYVTLKDKNAVAIVDPRSLSVVRSWKLADCDNPHGLVKDVEHGTLLVGCSDQTSVIRISDGATVGNIQTYGISDQSAFDPTRELAFLPGGNGADTLKIVMSQGEATFKQVQSIGTLDRAKMVVVDVRTNRVFTVGYDSPLAPTTRPLSARDSAAFRAAFESRTASVLVIGN
jgi:hypothetical protein